MKRTDKRGGKELRQNWIEYTFREETFKVCEQYYVDEKTGEEYSTTKQDELVVQQAYNQYRVKHHIPFPDEIKAIRDQYGLSAAKMSEVLDLGTNSYRNYENGKIPSLANAKLIRLAKDPHNFLRFLEEKKEKFSANIYKKVLAQVHKLMEKDRMTAVVEYIWNFHMEANEFTGFVKPTFEKVAHFVLFFAEKVRPMKTRLNKLLFYGDFLNFRETGFAISGCNYRAIPYGPVPSHFHELFGILETENYIRIEQELSEQGNIGERFAAARPFDPTLFSEAELENMQKVVDTFEDVRTKQLIEFSHQEEGWEKSQEKRELINYQEYAFQLKAL